MTIWIWKDSGYSLYLDDLEIKSDNMASDLCSGNPPSDGHNLLENGSFETGTTTWYTNHNSLQVTSNAYNGTKAIYLGSYSGSIAQSENTAHAGKTYTARGMFHRPPGSPWTGIGIDFFDAGWHEISDVYTEIPETNGYAPVVVSGVAPAGTVHTSVWIYKKYGGSLTLDALSLIEGDTPDAYVQSTGADQLWFGPQPRNGSGVTVAVVDSGIADHQDLNQAGSSSSRVVYSADLTSSTERSKDQYGHGTHVAGIIGGNGATSNGVHRGIAPGVNLINMRISDGKGMTYSSDLIEGLQWLYEHKDAYNIRVVNLSLNSTVPESYHTSPIDAAVELLWFSGMTVVVSAGNNGTAEGPVPIFAPANDPFVITVGAADDRGTGFLEDDTVATFSAYGPTIEGFAKPDLVASGSNIVSLSAGYGATIVKEHPSHKVGNSYFRMSGTSMAAGGQRCGCPAVTR
ncbi:MAG: S8 family serine peptidase [Caldilineaceae bacterium]